MPSTFRNYILLFLFAGFFTASCNTSWESSKVQYDNYRISDSTPGDTAVEKLLKPYTDSLTKSMNVIIGEAAHVLIKKSPESTLGNWMADVMLSAARSGFNTHVDASFFNYGGIRLNELPAGKITLGRVFELMPFDNVIVLQRVKGQQLLSFLNLTASLGGWPVSGITMQIKDKKAVNVFINGKPLDLSSEYTIANTDYIANGGDNADMLKMTPQKNMGLLFRDALIEHISDKHRAGEKIESKEEGRVVYVQ